jgi:hypothetical protein
MKALTFLALTLALALGALSLVQTRRVDTQQATIASLKTEAEASAKKIEKLTAAEQQLQEQRRELLQQADDLARQLQEAAKPKAAPERAATPAPSVKVTALAEKGAGDKANLGGFLKSMMSDPDTKKFIQEQQRLMAEQLYAPLAKQLGMTPEEATQFKKLLADNMAQATERASSMFDAGSTNRTAMMKELAADQKSFEDEVKSFLGDSRYQQYKDYQLTVGERAQFNMFKQQSQTGEYPVTDQQMEQLLGFVRDEKQRLTAAGQSVPGSGNESADLKAALGKDQADKMLASQEQLNQKVYERASTVLSPDQMQSFARFQTNQLQMMRMGYNMARQFMGGDKSSADGSTASP